MAPVDDWKTLACIETVSAVTSAGLVAPFISIIDKAIFSNASGREPLGVALVSGFKTLLQRPLYFCKQPSFLLIFGVYAGTYTVGNNVQGYYEHRKEPWQWPKFIASSFANVSLSVVKDSFFTKAFGTGAAKPVPLASYSLYTVRDSLTIFASFNLPTLLADQLSQSFGVSVNNAETIAQLVTPCAVQFISTPLHLLGMDLYNRPQGQDRWTFIKQEYVKTTAARMGRIFPAFGIGGVTNKALRKYLKHEFMA